MDAKQNTGSVHLCVLVMHSAFTMLAHTVQEHVPSEGAACPGWPSSVFVLSTSLQLCLLSYSLPPSKRVVPSPVLGKLFWPGSEAPVALAPVWTACPDPGVRMT